jgi:hypothetical protein
VAKACRDSTQGDRAAPSAGYFVSGAAREKKLTDRLRAGQAIVAAAVDKLRSRGVTEAEIRRLFEAELTRLTLKGESRG